VRKQTALFVIWMLAIGGYVIVNQTASSGAPLPAFSGYSTGTNVHASALRVAGAGPELADADVATSSAAVNSAGFLPGGVHNEENMAVVPTAGTAGGVDSAGKESYARGSGLEVGVGTNLPNDDLNQVVLGGIAEAGAQPAERSDGGSVLSANDTGLVDTSLVEITQGDPLLYARALNGQAQARFNEDLCLTDGALAVGQGETAKAELVDAASNAGTPDLDSPLVGTSSDFFGTTRGAVHTRSLSYLVANNDGTYGLATETHMTFAPISLLQTTPTGPAPVFIEILGEWVFKAVATGKTGGAFVSYTIEGVSSDPDTPVIRVYLAPSDANALPAIEIKRGQLFTDTGIDIPALPLLDLTLGEDPRAIAAPNANPDVSSSPTEAANGTVASGAADVIRLTALNPSAPLPDGPEVANIRVGHVEAAAQVPAGGIVCPAPPATTTTTAAGGSTTSSTTPGGSTSTTAPGASTSTTAPGASTSTTAPDDGTTSTTAADGSTTSSSTTSTTATVLGQQFSRGVSPGAQPVTAQPRFTG
jgi:hypothetical protein